MSKVSLYIHVPFCKRKCGYCDFYSVSDLSCMDSFVNALCRRMEELSPLVENREIDTVYFGGGTPGLLSPCGVEKIGNGMKKAFSLSSVREFTVEMNPETVTRDVLAAYRAIGADRISLGMQSARNEELKMLGRLHSHCDTEKAVMNAREEGFSRVSLDLMYGLPDQTVVSFQDSLERAVAMGVEHLSFYCLTLSQGVPLAKERARLPEDATLRTMYLSASSYLTSQGFSHYEISNAAKQGQESLHNLTYWEGREYLGIGPGAHSFLKGVRYSMAENLSSFTAATPAENLMREEERVQTKEALLTEYLLLSLRLKKGLQWGRLEALSDGEFCRKTKEKCFVWSKHGLCQVTDEGVSLTPEGFFVSNEIISELI